MEVTFFWKMQSIIKAFRMFWLEVEIRSLSLILGIMYMYITLRPTIVWA